MEQTARLDRMETKNPPIINPPSSNESSRPSQSENPVRKTSSRAALMAKPVASPHAPPAHCSHEPPLTNPSYRSRRDPPLLRRLLAPFVQLAIKGKILPAHLPASGLETRPWRFRRAGMESLVSQPLRILHIKDDLLIQSTPLGLPHETFAARAFAKSATTSRPRARGGKLWHAES